MKKSQKTLLAVGVATAMVALAGCSGGGNDTAAADFTTTPTGTLNAWGFDNADDVGTSRLDYAKAQLKDVDIKIDQTAFDAQKFTTRAASGSVPDIVQMDRQFVGTYAAQGLIQPLDKCFEAGDVDADERWYENVVDDVTYDDQMWGVPQFYQPPAIILNKKVMDAAGVTADQIDTSKPDVLIEAAKKMYKESGGNPTTIGFDPVATGQGELWMLGYGGQVIDDNGKPALDDPDNVKAIEFLTELADAQGGFAKMKSFSDSFDTFGDNNQFVADQVGAQLNAQWYVNVLSPYADQVEIEAVPFRDQDGEPFSVTGGTAFVIPTGAKNPSAACQWALDLTSQDAWMAAGEARADTIAAKPGAINTGLFTGSPEADKAVREKFVGDSGNAGFDQTISTFYDVAAEGRSFGSSPAGQAIKSELNNAITSALLGDKTPEKALEDAQAAAMTAYTQAGGQ